MKCTAWIRTCVDVFDHPTLDSGPYDRRSAWLWMIAKAARLDRRINHKGKPLEIKRGQLLGSRKFLAEKWGWSEQSVRTFLNALTIDGMIEINQSNGHYANVITICNYDDYQSAPKKENQSSNQSLTSAQPEPNQTLTENTQIDRSIVAREELKSAFNGSTANMLADIARWMGPSADSSNAAKWLTNMLADMGQGPTARAYQVLIAKEGSGERVASPLAFWSRTAVTIKANGSAEPSQPKSRERPAKSLRALLNEKLAKEAAP